MEHPVRQVGNSPARRGHGRHHQGGPGRGRSGRLPGADAPLLRARRSGDGDRLRRRRLALGHDGSGRLRQPGQGGRPVRRAAGAGRPVPGRCHRGRRGCHPRRHRRGAHRRDHGTRRRSRGPLRRQRLRVTSSEPVGRDDHGHRGVHPPHRRGPRRPRPHQRPVRGEGQPGVRHRGQPACLSDRPVRGQGHRGAAGQGGGAGHDRVDLGGAA